MPTHSSYIRRHGRRRRSGHRRSPEPSYNISHFIGIYSACVVALFVVAVAAFPVALFLYPVLGIVISRFVDKRIVWWNQSDNIENVANAKLHLIATWPLSMPYFIFKVFVSKYL